MILLLILASFLFLCYCSIDSGVAVASLSVILYCSPKMPRERRDSSKLSSLTRSSSPALSLPKNPLEDEENTKEWEDARCPVCMEHPHNAILLICSSHKKGCRPFMCDTSYRHSNCFDQFRNSFGEVSAVLQRPEDLTNSTLPAPATSSAAVSEAVISDLEGERSPERSIAVLAVPSDDPVKSILACPLCRGTINGWTVVKNARHFMNAKSRSCACETCDFNGTYTDLRKHARSEHPLVRPNDTDPERQRNWRRLERQRDLGDLLSTLQSSIGGEETTAEESTLTIDEGGWLTVFFLVRLIRPSNSSTRSRTSRTRAQVAVRRSTRRLWGETYDGDSDSRDDEDDNDAPLPSEAVASRTRRNVRRRLNPQEDNNDSSGSGEGIPRQQQ